MATKQQLQYAVKLALTIPENEASVLWDINEAVAQAWPDAELLVAAVRTLDVRQASVLIDDLKRAARPAMIRAFIASHPHQFRGQLWEPCRCGREPVNMPSHLCTSCLMRNEDHLRISPDPASGAGSFSNPEFDQREES